MRRSLAVAFALFATSGCGISERLDLTNQRLGTVNAQLDETNRRIGEVESKLDEANRRLDSMQGKLDEANRRLEVVEKAFPRFPGLRRDPAPPATSQPSR